MALVSALTEAAFVRRRQADWDRLDALLHAAQSRGLRALDARRDLAELSPLYRDVCADLSRAEAARYGAPLVDYLQGLAAAAHAVVYGSAGKRRMTFSRGSAAQIAMEAFPRAVRRHKIAMLVALLLFFVPLLAGLLATLADPAFALRVAPESQLRPLVEAYREGFSAGRGAGTDSLMAGFYVNNNVGIALRCFATGLVFGIGSAFYLVENGLVTGAVMGYVTSKGAGANIFTFVVGHGSLELGAIVLAGGAGLALGWSLVSPGEKTRMASMRACATSVIVVVFGAAIMLFMAAAIEGFWSSSSLPAIVKRSVGGLLFVLVSSYMAFGGRRSRRADALERSLEDEPWI